MVYLKTISIAAIRYQWTLFRSRTVQILTCSNSLDSIGRKETMHQEVVLLLGSSDIFQRINRLAIENCGETSRSVSYKLIFCPTHRYSSAQQTPYVRKDTRTSSVKVYFRLARNVLASNGLEV